MTKAEQIMSLYDGMRATGEIASIVGCRPEYVRVVARQRKGSRVSDIDRRYWKSDLGKSSRARSNRKRQEPLRASLTAYMAVVSETGSRDAANKAARDAYRGARQQGKSISEAKRLRLRIYARTLRATADKDRARAAQRAAYAAHIPVREAAE